MKKIYVDADACPVKDEIVKAATRHKIQVFMVCNGGIRPFRNNLINLIKTKYKDRFKIITAPGPNEISEAEQYDAIKILDNGKAFSISQLS